MKQRNLFGEQLLFHGGELAVRKRKKLRPLDSKRALHCVLKARAPILRTQAAWIAHEIRKTAARHHLKAYGLAVNRNHIHLVLKIPHRRGYRAFIRAFTACLALAFGKGLWALAPFTRILAWGRDFRRALAYCRQNEEEASGERTYQARTDWYRPYKRAKKDGDPAA